MERRDIGRILMLPQTWWATYGPCAVFCHPCCHSDVFSAPTHVFLKYGALYTRACGVFTHNRSCSFIKRSSYRYRVCRCKLLSAFVQLFPHYIYIYICFFPPILLAAFLSRAFICCNCVCVCVCVCVFCCSVP
jgi:hypothetical protein